MKPDDVPPVKTKKVTPLEGKTIIDRAKSALEEMLGSKLTYDQFYSLIALMLTVQQLAELLFWKTMNRESRNLC